MPAITPDQFATLSFGYLSGEDLMLIASPKLLIAEYSQRPQIIQQGCSRAYDEIYAKLSNRYDIATEFKKRTTPDANSNFSPIQEFNKTGHFQFIAPKNSYITKILFVAVSGNPTIQIGSSLDSNDILDPDNPSSTIAINSFYQANFDQYYFTDKTLYFNIQNGFLNIRTELIENYIVTTNNSNYDISTSFQSFNRTGQIQIPCNKNSFLSNAVFLVESGTPSIQIGTSLNGSDILEETAIENFLNINFDQYFDSEKTLYINITNGNLSLRFNIINNYINNDVAPSIRDNFLVTLTSIAAVRFILGNLGGKNEQLQSWYDFFNTEILNIQNMQSHLQLGIAPCRQRSKLSVIGSKYKTLG